MLMLDVMKLKPTTLEYFTHIKEQWIEVICTAAEFYELMNTILLVLELNH